MTDQQYPNMATRSGARLCSAKLKRKGGDFCSAIAIRGTPYCKYHGGRRLAKARNVVRIYGIPVSLRFYSRQLSQTLSDRLRELAEAPQDQQRSLWQELALMRALAGDSLALYDAAQQSGKPEIAVPAATLLRQALAEVAEMCEAAVKVDTLSKSTISVAHFGALVDQISVIATRVFGDDPRAIEFEKLIREQIKLPTKEGGTTVQPTDDVIAMDSTIPRA